MGRLGSTNLVDNLGIMLLFLAVLVLVVLIIVGLAFFLRKNKKAQELF